MEVRSGEGVAGALGKLSFPASREVGTHVGAGDTHLLTHSFHSVSLSRTLLWV